MQYKIQKIDKAIETVDIKLKFQVVKLAIDLTGNKADFYGNSKLMSFGVEDQGFTIEKAGQKLTVNLFGVTIGSYNKFEELYKFGMRTKNTMQKVTEELAGVVSQEQYILDMRTAIEEAKGLKDKSSVAGGSNHGSTNNEQIRMNNNYDPRSQLASKQGQDNKLQPRQTAKFGANGQGNPPMAAMMQGRSQQVN